MERTVRTLTAALAACAALLAAAAPASADPPACPPGAACGTLVVPLDRGAPLLGTTTVGYALVPRRDAARAPAGTIVPNPGGPGYAADYDVAQLDELFGTLRDDHDVLLVDPRGVGRSTRLDCGLPADPLLSPAQFKAATGACGRTLGARANAYGSAAVADDLDAVRAHLGIARLDLFGESYGSFLFSVYARRHPSRVASLVLSGAYPIAFDPLGRDRAAALRRAIDLVCSRSGGRCSGPLVRADLSRLTLALRARPLDVDVDGTPIRLDEESLAGAVYFAWAAPEILGMLPGLLRAANAGRPEPLAELVALVRQTTIDEFQDGGPVSFALNVATSCRDYPALWSRSAPLWLRRAQYATALGAAGTSAFLPFAPQVWVDTVGEGGDWCIEWPDVPGGESPLAGASRPALPVLAINGDLDVNTPSSAARQAAAQFTGARFLEVPNVGHTPGNDASGCSMAIVRSFIRTHAVGDTSCMAQIPPIEVG